MVALGSLLVAVPPHQSGAERPVIVCVVASEKFIWALKVVAPLPPRQTKYNDDALTGVTKLRVPLVENGAVALNSKELLDVAGCMVYVIPVLVVVLLLVIVDGQPLTAAATQVVATRWYVGVTNTKLPVATPSTAAVVDAEAALPLKSATMSWLKPVTGTLEYCAFETKNDSTIRHVIIMLLNHLF